MGVIAFDIDGVLANFTRGFTRIAHQIYGTPVGDSASQETWNFEDYPALGLDKERADFNGPTWTAIKTSHDFWATLDPFNVSVMPRIDRIPNKIFITNRPGINTVEQSIHFLETWGIQNPKVIVGSEKGPIAIRENVVAVVDDLYKNVVDINKALPSCYSALLYCNYNKIYHDEWVNHYCQPVVLSLDHFIDKCYERNLVESAVETDDLDAQIRQHIAIYRASELIR